MKKTILAIDIDGISKKTLEKIEKFIDNFKVVYWIDEIEIEG